MSLKYLCHLCHVSPIYVKHVFLELEYKFYKSKHLLLSRQVLPLGGQVQQPQRVGRLPPLGLRLKIAGHQAQGDGSRRVPSASALRLYATGKQRRRFKKVSHLTLSKCINKYSLRVCHITWSDRAKDVCVLRSPKAICLVLSCFR
jgi:hypothetical protein